jgi:hypothetical protein
MTIFFALNSISKGTMSVTLQTGAQIPFLYAAVAKKDWDIVGGADETVAVAAG